jgi:Asp-tRNA(Asn)/Glu-tRNA(Gln) amidotransferase A subunit family amidase
MLTQPISVAGLWVITMLFLCEGKMPVGVQITAPPWREDVCFSVVRSLEQSAAADRGSLRVRRLK